MDQREICKFSILNKIKIFYVDISFLDKIQIFSFFFFCLSCNNFYKIQIEISVKLIIVRHV